jgi:hypothetical protein
MKTNRILAIGAALRAAMRPWLCRGALAVLGAAVFLLSTGSARAACGDPTFSTHEHIALPLPGPAGPQSDSIVGLWHVTYWLGTSVFNETLDQWHSDGTEFENAYLSPLGGNICFGVWKPTGPRSVKLHHIGWTFSSDGTTLTGYFTLDEENTVAPNGMSYSGNFTFKTFNTDGSPAGTDLSGTMDATRITVE